MRALTLLFCAAAGTSLAAAQPVSEPAPAAVHAAEADSVTTRLFLPDGAPLALPSLLARLDTTDVLFLGEQHDDAVGHAFQRLLLDAIYDRYADARPVVLAMEMFERDVQLVLDEYLAGQIREKDFLAAARPWSNYETDYRPLVEAAKAHHSPVIASNAPARYVSRVGRGEALEGLSAAALNVLPPMPVAPPSDTLRSKFFGVMEAIAAMHVPPPDTAASPDSAQAMHHAMPTMDLGAMLAAQNLRDWSMATAIQAELDHYDDALVVHVNGSFHSEGGLGIPEHLDRLSPAARVLVLTAIPVPDASAFSNEHADKGDVIALTGRPADTP
jgi:uncharacterized iron-regulated protein